MHENTKGYDYLTGKFYCITKGEPNILSQVQLTDGKLTKVPKSDYTSSDYDTLQVRETELPFFSKTNSEILDKFNSENMTSYNQINEHVRLIIKDMKLFEKSKTRENPTMRQLLTLEKSNVSQSLLKCDNPETTSFMLMIIIRGLCKKLDDSLKSFKSDSIYDKEYTKNGIISG